MGCAAAVSEDRCHRFSDQLRKLIGAKRRREAGDGCQKKWVVLRSHLIGSGNVY